MSDITKTDDLVRKFGLVKAEISKKIVGQHQAVDQILLAILCSGHSLLIGVPGLAKTMLIQTISEVLGLDFKRIQFTPDLMPSDILGSEILGLDKNIEFRKGPIFSNMILADEINRTPPKTQAALLEAMQEKSVSIAGYTHKLDKPFFVLATQNPIEQEGTYPLPEAQLDRFIFSINMDYPSFDEEVEIVKKTTNNDKVNIETILNSEDIITFQELVRKTPVTDNVVKYAVNLTHSTRPNSNGSPKIVKDYLDWGAGPRASQNMILAAKANAIINGKYSPDIEDVKKIAYPVLNHRVVRNYKAEADGVSLKDIISELM
ncbi:MAG: MoxR family ATPase [Flavobacteriaceae bacterium]|nr:MoxR family ATPase [Flavobacteriaceae bacterium]